MKRSDLNDEYKKKFDAVVDQMMAEIEEEESKHPLAGAGNVLNNAYNQFRRNIEKKYLPILRQILNDAEKEMGMQGS